MLIFLYGQDTYRSRKKLAEIIEGYKKTGKSGLNLIRLEVANLKFRDFFDSIRQVSMFGEKKLVVLLNVFANHNFKEKFLEKAKDFVETEDIIIFYESGNVPAKDKFANFLKKEAKSQEFSILKGQKLKNWIKGEFLSFGVKVEEGAVSKLAEFAGNDPWLLAGEIKKLSCFKKREGKVEVGDVEKMVFSGATETSIFKTVDAISEKNKKQSLLLLRQHLDKGDNPLMLLSMINFQFKNLLAVKELMEKGTPYYVISKIAKLHPFVLKKSYQQASGFTLFQLKKICREISQTDFNIKTGKMKPEAALEFLIARL